MERQRAWEWLVTDLLPLGSPTTNNVVLGTPIHREAIVQKLRATPGWTAHIFRSVDSWPERMDLWDRWETLLRTHTDRDCIATARAYYEANRAAMDAGATVQWPEGGYDLYFLMAKLAGSGLAAFKSEYQCDPDNPDLYEWPGELFDAEKRPELYFDEWPEVLRDKVLALDPSKGSRGDKPGDYTAFVLFGRDLNGVEYVDADLFRGNQEATLTGIVQRAVKHVREFQPNGFGFEAVGFQSLFGGQLRQALANAQLEVALYPLEDNDPKETRIRRLTEPLVQRRVRFKRSKGGMLLVEQLREFPTAERDDGPDALEQARRLALRLQRGRLQGRSQHTQFRL